MADISASIQTLVELGQKIGVPVGTEAVHYAVVPNGTQLQSLAQYQYPHGIPPVRIVATPRFQDAASFSGYVNDFKDSRTRIFADADKQAFVAVLDYHNAGAEHAPEFLSQCPETFAISIPVFFGQAPVAIEARLRFRIAEGRLKFQYKLYRPAEVLAVAFDAACAAVKTATETEVLLGCV